MSQEVALEELKELKPGDEVPEGYMFNKNGTLVTTKGHFISGIGGGHTGGRPKRLVKLDEIMSKKFGPNIEKAAQRLCDIALAEPKENLFKQYSSQQRLSCLFKAIEYFYGKPKEMKEIQKNVDINFEGKVADLTKLINERNTLKLVKSDVTEDIIQD